MPIFIVHGDHGNDLLPAALPADIPVYAFHHMRFDGRSLTYHSISEIASMYVTRLRAVQPFGPYFLSGYSIGGLIAFEMARLLTAQGESVSRLVMIDSRSPLLKSSRNYHNRQFRFNESRISKMFRKAWKTAAVRFSIALGLPIPKRHRAFYIMELYRKGRRQYRPLPYNGNAILVRSTINNFGDPCLGWRDLILGELECIPVEADHHRIMEDPAVQRVAAILREVHDPTLHV